MFGWSTISQLQWFSVHNLFQAVGDASITGVRRSVLRINALLTLNALGHTRHARAVLAHPLVHRAYSRLQLRTEQSSHRTVHSIQIANYVRIQLAAGKPQLAVERAKEYTAQNGNEGKAAEGREGKGRKEGSLTYLPHVLVRSRRLKRPP